MCLTADPGVVSSITAWDHTFVEIDHEINFTVILLPYVIQEGLFSVTSESTNMTIAIDWDVKNQTKPNQTKPTFIVNGRKMVNVRTSTFIDRMFYSRCYYLLLQYLTRRV